MSLFEMPNIEPIGRPPRTQIKVIRKRENKGRTKQNDSRDHYSNVSTKINNLKLSAKGQQSGKNVAKLPIYSSAIAKSHESSSSIPVRRTYSRETKDRINPGPISLSRIMVNYFDLQELPESEQLQIISSLSRVRLDRLQINSLKGIDILTNATHIYLQNVSNELT
jgi:hypothetical protein